MPRTILLAGAPQASHKWQEEDLTVTALLPLLACRVDDHDKATASVVPPTQVFLDAKLTATQAPKWRSLALHNEHLPRGLTQPIRDNDRAQLSSPPPSALSNDDHDHDYTEEGISFLTTTSTNFDPTSTADGPDEEATQFLEQSFALHDDPFVATQTSHPLNTPVRSHHGHPAATPADAPSTYSTTFTSTIPTPGPPIAPSTLPSLPNLSTLATLPKARTLTAMAPQTPTIDLLVGIISVSAPRSVVIRRTGKVVDLVECLMGDETKAGFQVTFWLGEEREGRALGIEGAARNREGGERGAINGLRAQASALRPGMVVAVRNIALRAFRDVVSGQSLGRRGWGGTSITVISDDLRMEKQAGKGVGMEERVRKRVEGVREWTRRFVRPVGVKAVVSRGSRGRSVDESELKDRKRPFGSIAASELPEDETQEVVL